MESIISFFIEPYQQAETLDVILEIIAVILGVTSVLYAVRENILVFPTGIISTGIFIYLLYKYTLFGDMIVNGYYTVMSIYGWIQWSKSKKKIGIESSSENETEASWTNKRDRIISTLIFTSTVAFVIVVYLMNDRFDRWTDYVDTFTTGIFFTAMWLMANKKIESWHFWIIANIISIPLYFYKGLGFTGLQYIIFLILALNGLKAWKQSYSKKKIVG
ncbi:MAG: nicotinamide mononucleotide transporter [Gammaproteobacteria bacterium]|jgi:nicotinamide mononucleotide transporter